MVPSGNPYQSENVLTVQSPKVFITRKKAVSFHGFIELFSPYRVEVPKGDDCMQWCLALKRSSASTNVSVLNLAAVDQDDSPESEESFIGSDGNFSTSELSSSSQAELDEETFSVESQDLTSSSGLTKAKDSITNLKKKSAKINQHVQTLKNECSALCENLELRHEEAEQLENYCNQLEESCRKVNTSVEEAEIKTNAMKQNYITLEEKLHYLYREVQEHFGKREKQLQDLEQRVTASIAKHSAEASLGQAGLQGAGARTETTQQSDLNKDIATLLISIRGLQLTMEMDAQKLRSGKEVAVLGTQQMKEILAALAEIRDSIVQLHAKYEQEIMSHKNEHMTVFHTSTRFDSFLSQWERTQKEQRHMMENIQELQANMDGIYSLVKRISSSYGQTRSELDAFWQMKPLLEEVSRHLTIMRIQDTTEISAPRTSSFNISTIKQVIDQALSPLLEEMKSCNQHNTCTNCQSMQKKILELEGQMAEKRMQAVVLCSDLRLVQDDATRLQNMLLRDRIKTEGKPVLDNITIKICSLQEQLSKLCLNKYSPLLEASNTISPGPCSCLERNDQCDDDTTKE